MTGHSGEVGDRTTSDKPSAAANAVFAFVPANYDITGQQLVGRQSASEGFLRGFVRHSGAEAFWCYVQSGADYDQFRRFVA